MCVNGIQVNYDQIATKAGRTIKKVEEFVDIVRRSLVPQTKLITVRENGREHLLRVTRLGIGPILTEFGPFWQIEFNIDDQWGDYEVLLRADIDMQTLMPTFDLDKEIVVRPDSGCATGQRFADLTCDCKDQLLGTMKEISEAKQGLIIHVPSQDGRGRGLAFKLGTLWLQQQLAVNTVEAASILASDGIIDVRTYAGAICLMKFLGLPQNCITTDAGDSETEKHCRLVVATNNPEKLRAFTDNGYEISRRLPVAVPPTKHTRHHFEAKKRLLGHEGIAA